MANKPRNPSRVANAKTAREATRKTTGSQASETIEPAPGNQPVKFVNQPEENVAHPQNILDPMPEDIAKRTIRDADDQELAAYIVDLAHEREHQQAVTARLDRIWTEALNEQVGRRMAARGLRG